jgi:hypothetical protein
MSDRMGAPAKSDRRRDDLRGEGAKPTSRLRVSAVTSLLLAIRPKIKSGSAQPSSARRAGRTLFTESESQQLLASHGIPVTPTEVAATADQAVEKVSGFKRSVALKLCSETITHKTDVGGVKPNFRGYCCARGLSCNRTQLSPRRTRDGLQSSGSSGDNRR